MKPVRVVSWNVRRGREPGFEAGVDAITALQPDVVLLQEVGRPAPGGPPGARGTDQVIAERLGARAFFFPTLVDPRVGDYGVSILTRLPVTASGSASVFVFDGMEPRLACWVVTAQLAVATAHLSNQPQHLPRHQMRAALDSLPDEVVLLVGDLNHRPRRRHYGRWRRVPNNGWRTSRTFPAAGPRRAIDHVLTTRPDQVLATRVLRISGSDHLPVLVEWRQTGSTERPPSPPPAERSRP